MPQVCTLKTKLSTIRGQCSTAEAYAQESTCEPLRELSSELQKACPKRHPMDITITTMLS